MNQESEQKRCVNDENREKRKARSNKSYDKNPAILKYLQQYAVKNKTCEAHILGSAPATTVGKIAGAVRALDPTIRLYSIVFKA